MDNSQFDLREFHELTLKNIVKHLTLYRHLLFYRCYIDICYNDNNSITQQITVEFNHQCAEFEGIVSVDQERQRDL